MQNKHYIYCHEIVYMVSTLPTVSIVYGLLLHGLKDNSVNVSFDVTYPSSQ